MRRIEMTTEQILQCDSVAVGGEFPRQFVKSPAGGWNVVGLGFAGPLMKPFTDGDIRRLVNEAPVVLVQESILDKSTQAIVKGDI
jgi:hypothetical protein